MKDCICSKLERKGIINEFTSYMEFLKFEKELHSYVINHELEEIKFHKKDFWEIIYKCKTCGRQWVLIEPENSYKGKWHEHTL